VKQTLKNWGDREMYSFLYRLGIDKRVDMWYDR